LNWEYVKRELELLKLVEFEQNLTKLVKAVFAEQSNELEEELAEMLEYMLDSGTYGRVETYVQNKIKKMTAEKGTSVRMGKLLYFKDRIFPNKKWWEENYPICKGRYYLIPFCWVYRMIVKTCTNGSKAIREIKAAL